MVSLIRILCSTPVCIRNWLPRSRIAGIAAGHIDPEIPVTRATPRLTMIDPPPPSILPRFMEQYTRRSNLRCSLRVDFFQRLGVVGRERRGGGREEETCLGEGSRARQPGGPFGGCLRGLLPLSSTCAFLASAVRLADRGLKRDYSTTSAKSPRQDRPYSEATGRGSRRA